MTTTMTIAIAAAMTYSRSWKASPSERSGFSTAGRLQDVHGQVHDDPHDVDEVPVDPRYLDAAVGVRREVAAEGADHDHQEKRESDEDVRAVEARQAVEDRRLREVARREADVDVLVDLDEEERRAEQERAEDARLPRAAVAALDALQGPVDGQRARDQDRRVEARDDLREVLAVDGEPVVALHHPDEEVGS